MILACRDKKRNQLRIVPRASEKHFLTISLSKTHARCIGCDIRFLGDRGAAWPTRYAAGSTLSSSLRTRTLDFQRRALLSSVTLAVIPFRLNKRTNKRTDDKSIGQTARSRSTFARTISSVRYDRDAKSFTATRIPITIDRGESRHAHRQTSSMHFDPCLRRSSLGDPNRCALIRNVV